MHGSDNDNIIFGAAGRLLFIISALRDLTDARWDDGLEALERITLENGGFDAAIVLSVHAAANAAQRRRLAERMVKLGIVSQKICLLSNSAVARATVPALARLLRMNTQVAAFKTNEWRKGLEWLQRTITFDFAQAEAEFIEGCRRARVDSSVVTAK